MNWEGEPWNPGWLAWVTDTSIPSWIGEIFTLELGFQRPSPGGGWPRCRIAGNTASFYIGEVPDLPAAPPDFGTDSEETIREGMVALSSPFVPRFMSTTP
jgi:hypothetical protein